MLVAKHLGNVVLDVGGVGYEIAVTPATLADLPPVGDEAVLHTHTYVREDTLALYGFATADQREIFRLLLGVSGIGPRVAMTILATLSTDDLRRAVAADDADMLTLVPGIGKRSAQKLMLELRPKLDLPDTELPVTGSGPGEVREALEGLGYRTAEIREAMRDLPGDIPVADLLRMALKELGRRQRSGDA
jgi:Holliday junction DNA helicase RuvA